MVLIEMIVFAAIIFALNFSITRRSNNEAKAFLTFLAKNNGHRPPPKGFHNKKHHDGNFIPPDDDLLRDIDATSSASLERPDDFFRNLTDFFRIQHTFDANMRNYFSVRTGGDGKVLELIQDFPINYTSEEIQTFVDEVLNVYHTTGKKCDMYSGAMFYILDLSPFEKLICVLNRNSELKTLGKFYIYSVLLYILSIIVSVLISLPISKFMVKPAKDAFIKQKQFIADASHELKTPIAVIGANIDVLESEIKGNKWLEYIKTENRRMGELVKDLLYLAKNDAGRNELHFFDFDFSNAVENSILPFEVLAFESQKTLELNVQKGIICNGDEKSLKQIFIILVDNALKNSEEGAKITVTANGDDKRIVFKVHNTGAGIPKEELEKIFLRFYRSDYSRARKTGGYGLGLAIARTIAEDHGGTLTANSEVGQWAEFTLVIPRKK
ncbi:MAG: HAMP domain-containing histidine kinase [Treponema sp.]|nr:HAMP domain-containing histidine kinase [Treponema sp.]